MAILSKEQRVYIVETYFRTNSIKQVKAGFTDRFPERELPSTSTIQRNVEKYRKHATSLNRNKEKSGRKRTARSDENIERVGGHVEGRAE